MNHSVDFFGAARGGGFVCGGFRRTNRRAAAGAALVVRSGRVGRRRPNESGRGGRGRGGGIAGGGFDLVFSGTPVRPPGAGPPLPHLAGAGLMRAPNAGCVCALRDKGRGICQIYSGFEHAGAATGGQLRVLACRGFSFSMGRDRCFTRAVLLSRESCSATSWNR